jgi:hypothetical protein
MPGVEDPFSSSGNRDPIPIFAIWAGGRGSSTTFELGLGIACSGRLAKSGEQPVKAKYINTISMQKKLGLIIWMPGS